TGGAEGSAHGQLAGSGHRAGEQEVREVGAGDEQHEAGETDDHGEDAPGLVGGHAPVDRNGAPAGLRIDGGEVGGEAATELGDQGSGLLAGEGEGATPDEAERGRAAVAGFLFRESRGMEKVD